MKRTLTFAIPIVAMALCVVLPCCAQKTTAGPNVRQSVVTPVEKPDSRLEQKVNYACVGRRLHSVLEGLSSATSVLIDCGNGKDDWQVRDLPIIVTLAKTPSTRFQWLRSRNQ